MSVHERSVRFNGMSIRALVARRKTQSRFAVKGQHPDWDKITPELDVNDKEFFVVCGRPEEGGLRPILAAIHCPYGQKGDRLWVRETFSVVPDHDEPAGYSAILYRADAHGPYEKWRASTQMPREASRFLLEIEGVRVERLHDISEQDAMAEGAARDDRPDTANCTTHESVRVATFQYRSIWKDENQDWNWECNPWVWAVEFRILGAADL